MYGGLLLLWNFIFWFFAGNQRLIGNRECSRFSQRTIRKGVSTIRSLPIGNFSGRKSLIYLYYPGTKRLTWFLKRNNPGAKEVSELEYWPKNSFFILFRFLISKYTGWGWREIKRKNDRNRFLLVYIRGFSFVSHVISFLFFFFSWPYNTFAF